jgi:lysophospholipase L1-like esterase
MERTGESLSPYVPHRFIGYVPAPGFRRGENFHDALGFRGGPIPQPKPAGEFRIAALGESTTYGAHVANPAQAWPAQLERALRERGLPQVRAVNAGAEGWSTTESLVNFALRVLDLEPDLAVVYHGLNDLFGRMVWPPDVYRGDNSGAVLHSPGLERAVPLLERSALARMLLVSSGRIPSQLALLGNFTRIADSAHYFAFAAQLERGVYPAGLFRRVSAAAMLEHNPPVFFRRNLESLAALARAHGVAIAFATFALCECVQSDRALVSAEVRQGVAEHNRVIEEVGAALGVPVFRFAEVFPRDPELFSSAVHLSARGYRLQGELFADFLMQAGLLPPAARAGP